MKNYLVGLFSFVSFYVLAFAAWAQDTIVMMPTNLVEFFMYTMFLIVSGIISVFLPPILMRMSEKYKLDIEAEKVEALQIVFTNAASGLIQKLGEEAKNLKVDLKNPHIAEVVQRALNSAPENLRWANLTEEEIAGRILEKIHQVAPTSETKVVVEK